MVRGEIENCGQIKNWHEELKLGLVNPTVHAIMLENRFLLLGRLILTELIDAFDKPETLRYNAWADFLPEPYA